MAENSSIMSGVTESQSTSTGINAPFQEIYWIVCEAILVVVTVITLYLLVCLLRYASMTKCKPGREISGSRKGKILYQMCLISVIMAIGRLIADQVVAFLGWQSDSNCSNAVATSAVFYSLSLYPVYIFLWLRQSIFYHNPVLSHVLNPAITLSSWLTLIFMIVGGAVITVFYVVPDINRWNYVASADGCRDISDLSGFELVPTILVCFTVCFQVSLLGLFIYPLLSEKTQRYRRACRNERRLNPERANSIASEPNEDDSSNPCCSTEQGSGFQKCISDINFESIDGNPSFIESLSSSNSKVSRNSDVKNGKVSPSKRGKITLNGFPQQPNGETHQKKKQSTKSPSSSLFNMLKRGRSVSLNSTAGEANKSKRFKRNKTQQGRRVIKFIRKAFLLALICVVSDIVFTVAQLMIVFPELVYLVLFDINLLINIICIIVSFREWKHMILPICSRFSKRKPRGSSRAADKLNHSSQISMAVYRTKLTNQLTASNHVPHAMNGSIIKIAAN